MCKFRLTEVFSIQIFHYAFLPFNAKYTKHLESNGMCRHLVWDFIEDADKQIQCGLFEMFFFSRNEM